MNIKEKITALKWFTGALVAIVIFLCTLGQLGCAKYPVSEAVKDLNKAYVNYPDTTADLTRAWFPCITKASDTVYSTKDSVVYVECPDVVNGNAEDYAGKDTVRIIKTVKVPVTLPVRIQTITKYIEDSAKIKSYATELDKTYKKNYDLQKTIEQLQQDKAGLKEARNKWRFRFFVLLAVFGAAVVLRVKKIL